MGTRGGASAGVQGGRASETTGGGGRRAWALNRTESVVFALSPRDSGIRTGHSASPVCV